MHHYTVLSPHNPQSAQSKSPPQLSAEGSHMTSDEILLDVEERMEKAVRKLKSDLAGIRTGRANPGLVDSLRVEVYGSPTPLKQIASVGAPEPNQIVIRRTTRTPSRRSKKPFWPATWDSRRRTTAG